MGDWAHLAVKYNQGKVLLKGNPYHELNVAPTGVANVVYQMVLRTCLKKTTRHTKVQACST